MHYYLAPWEWVDRPLTDPNPYRGWNAPHAEYRVGGFDIRSGIQRKQRGGTPGIGLFVYDRLVTMGGSELYLGDDPQATLTAVQRDGLEKLTGMRTTESDLLNAIRQYLGDPAFYSADNYLAGVGPLKVGVNGRVHMWLAGQHFVDEPSDALSRAASTAVFQQAFRHNVSAARYSDRVLRKWAAATSLRIHRQLSDDSVNAVLPPEYQGFGWERPTTIVGPDNFNDTEGPMTGWTDVEGGWSSNGTKATNNNSSSDDTARFDTALSSDDQYAYCDCESTVTQYAGIALRFDPSVSSCYCVGKQAGTTYIIGELNSGAFTTHATGTGTTGNQTVGGEVGVSGADDIECFEDYLGAKTSRVTHTDTATLKTGNLRLGIWTVFGTANRAIVDNWNGGDVVAGVFTTSQAIIIG